jgi:hypothetical protein
MPLKPPPAQALFSHPRAKDWLAWLAAIMVGLAIAIIPYLFNHRFYFNDDEQNAAYPYFYEIGRQLHAHHLPYLTLATFNGGNLILDWEAALLNPITLLCYWLFYFARDLTTAGLLFCGFYIVLTALAAYSLGRSFHLSRALSLVAATVIVTDNFAMYFHADSWTSGLTCQCWLLWTWGSLQRYRSSGSTTSLAFFVIFAYLTVTSGWPHGDLMLACLIIGYAVELVMAKAGFARLNGLILASVSALLLTLPTLLPAILSFAWTNRVNAIYSNGFFMPNLGDVLNFSSFFHPLHVQTWSGNIVFLPFCYVAWFIWVFIPLFRWEIIKSSLAEHVALLAFTAFGLLMLFGPGQFGPIRLPLRFIPFVHVGFIFTFLLVLNQPEAIALTPRRVLGSATAILLSYLSSISSQPGAFYRQLFGFTACIIFAWLAIKMAHLRRPLLLSFILACGMFTGFVLTHLIFPTNELLPDLMSRSFATTEKSPANRPFDGYSLCLGGRSILLDKSPDIFFAAQGIYKQQYTINGETSLGHRVFDRRFHNSIWTNIEGAEGISTLFVHEHETGSRVIDLMRVNSLLVANGNVAKLTLPLLSNDWRETRSSLLSSSFERIHPNLQPTTLSWSSPGIQVVPEAPPTGEKETLQVKAGRQGGFLVFARLYWPGYHAELDGRPLAVDPLAGLFVRVTLPPDNQGRFILTFVPPGIRFGYAGACLGILLFVISLAVAHRGSRHTKMAN